MLSISMGGLDSEVLKRYANGNCTEAEQMAVEHWLENGDGESGNPGVQNPELEREIWNNMVEQVEPVPSGYRFRHFIYLTAAASVLIFMGLFFFHNFSATHQKVGLKTLTVPEGQQLILKLADQSTINLSGGSRIRYAAAFPGRSREVTLLKGEAFFNISHNSEKPFLVHTPASSIQVLGTKFNVDNSGSSQQMSVTLTQGSISFRSRTGKSALLKPGQQLVFLKSKAMIQSVKTVDTNMVTGWTKGLLWFDHTPVSQVLEKLERHYGVHFYHPKGLKLDAEVTAKFQEQSLTRVLGLIENFTSLRFIQKGKRVNVDLQTP